MGKLLLPRRPTLIALIALTTACTVQQTNVPSLTGPSEFALSVAVAAKPDIITRDGFSQSTISITARDANGAPKPQVSFRVDMLPQDFGTLSTRSVSTGSEGQATLSYTAPSPPVPGTAVPVDRITIAVVPINSNYQTANQQTAEIRLVLPIIVGGDTPIAQFVFSPTKPAKGQKVTFDASSSTAPSGRSLVKYSWDWGDGEAETGNPEEHDYQTAGTFIVVLTVTDSAGVSASITSSITVTGS